MVRFLYIGVLGISVLLSSSASGQTLDQREKRVALLRGHHGRLEQQLSEQAKRIKRLKSQPAGVGRDYQLKSTLRTSQQLARRLTKLRDQLRRAYLDLTGAYQRAIRQAADEAQKRALKKRSAALAKSQQSARSGQIVTNDETSPYDSAEDLEEKADLLEDSEEKVRRQLQRLRSRLARLKKRSRLHRHAADADDSPFVENAPRRTSRIRSSKAVAARTTGEAGGQASPTAGKTAEDGTKTGTAPPQSPDPAPGEKDADDYTDENKGFNGEDPGAIRADTQVPAPPPTGRGDWSAPIVNGGGTSASGASGASASATVQDVIDPDTLRKLAQAGSAGNVRSRLAALRKATTKLDRLASKLSRKAKSLRKRAKNLRQRK